MASDKRRVTFAENQALRVALRSAVGPGLICGGCGGPTWSARWATCRRCYERSQGWRGQVRTFVNEHPELRAQDGQGDAEGSGK
jgi:hypothetical protein